MVVTDRRGSPSEAPLETGAGRSFVGPNTHEHEPKRLACTINHANYLIRCRQFNSRPPGLVDVDEEHNSVLLTAAASLADQIRSSRAGQWRRTGGRVDQGRFSGQRQVFEHFLFRRQLAHSLLFTLLRPCQLTSSATGRSGLASATAAAAAGGRAATEETSKRAGGSERRAITRRVIFISRRRPPCRMLSNELSRRLTSDRRSHPIRDHSRTQVRVKESERERGRQFGVTQPWSCSSSFVTANSRAACGSRPLASQMS